MSEVMKEYWQQRIANNQNLIGTGHRAFNLAYNQALYERQRDTLASLLRTNQVDPAGKQVLDVGSGTGFYVEYFLNQDAAEVTGLDIAPASVDYLKQTYPQLQFYCVDMGQAQTLPVKSSFDIVSVISVLYHIIETKAFDQALINVCRVVAPNGYLVVSDMFKSTWQLTASHVRFRPLEQYKQIFDQFNLQIIDILPIYYLMNRTYIPILLPPILGLPPITRLLMNIDRQLGEQKVQWGAGLKMLLAKRVDA